MTRPSLFDENLLRVIRKLERDVETLKRRPVLVDASLFGDSITVHDSNGVKRAEFGQLASGDFGLGRWDENGGEITDGASGSGTHPSLTSHDTMGLATDTELAAHTHLPQTIAALTNVDISADDTADDASVLVFDGVNGAWYAAPGTTDTSGNAVFFVSAFGAVWGRKDTRRMCCIRSPGGTADTWTNMPVAVTEYLGFTLHRSRMDLAGATQMRVVAHVSAAGSANAKLRAQYSTDDGSTWSYLNGTAGGGSGPSLAINVTGTLASAWASLHANAQIESALVRLVGLDGDGVADPAFGNVHLETR